MSDAATDSSGGIGGAFQIDPRNTCADLKLLERALRQWEIPEELYRVIPVELAKIILTLDEDKKYVYSARERLAAMRCAALYDRKNLEVAAAKGLVRGGGASVQVQNQVLTITTEAVAKLSDGELDVLASALEKLTDERSGTGGGGNGVAR